MQTLEELAAPGKTVRLTVIMKASEREEIREAAAAAGGLGMSPWLLEVGLAQSRRRRKSNVVPPLAATLQSHQIPAAKRFWSKVDIRGPDECWPWTGATASNGYGNKWYEEKDDKAHRVAWIVTNGPIPGGVVIRHDCDNPPCCNPAHLLDGTHKDNSDDKIRRGRHARGEKIGMSETPPERPPEARVYGRACRALRRGPVQYLENRHAEDLGVAGLVKRTWPQTSRRKGLTASV